MQAIGEAGCSFLHAPPLPRRLAYTRAQAARRTHGTEMRHTRFVHMYILCTFFSM